MRPSSALLIFQLLIVIMNAPCRAAVWHTHYARHQVCDPYPGCASPNVPLVLCPYTFLGEMCTLIQRARTLGMAKGALIVEVGSAFGYGIWTARYYGHPILAFECRRDEFDRLRKQFENDPQVKVVHACVSSKAGTTVLHRALDSSSMLSKNVGKGPAEVTKVAEEAKSSNATVEKVRTVTLDDMLGVLDVTGASVGAIAIDVQGVEDLVLHGAKKTIRRHRPHIMYEATMFKMDRKQTLVQEVMASLQTEAPSYQTCYCERDCICPPTTSNATSNVSPLATFPGKHPFPWSSWKP